MLRLLRIRKPAKPVLLLPLVIMALLASAVHSQPLLPCGDRPAYLNNPWTDATRFCLELAIQDDSAGELGFTSLAAAPDGTLYAARPLGGEVLALSDSDGDGLPDRSRVAASGLTLPNGLAYAGGALYISGGAHLYRLRAGALETLVDDLPSGGGFWTGGVTVGLDQRLYVATGAPCDACEVADQGRGAILSFDMDGGDRKIVAAGLRNPSDLVFHGGTLWTLDSARDALFDIPDLDELNHVGAGAHFGWPYCIGSENWPDLFVGAFDCAGATPPVLTFPTASGPVAIASYTSEAIPALKNTLLVVLRGSNNHVELRGYALVAVHFDAGGQPTYFEAVIPSETGGGNRLFEGFSLETMNYRLSGFWPRRPIDVTVSVEGWIYISVGGGRILALRPQ